MADKKYEVSVYFDGPWINDDAVIRLAAADEADAVREAIALVGPPKIGEVKEVS
jgi:hypothetical protein